jgi:acetyl-CoA acyltransferase
MTLMETTEGRAVGRPLCAVRLGDSAGRGFHRGPEPPLAPAPGPPPSRPPPPIAVNTSNLAREAALTAGVPNSVPAHTVTMACISANAAIATAAAEIAAGRASSAIVGGAETLSDSPIRLSRGLRQAALRANKAKKPAEYISILRRLKLSDLAIEAPAIAGECGTTPAPRPSPSSPPVAEGGLLTNPTPAPHSPTPRAPLPLTEYTTGEIMGHSSDRLAARWGVSRADQDAFAVRSHTGAAAAAAAGLLAPEIVPVAGHAVDNGVRGDSTVTKLATLKPSFVKPHGTHTAANSSFLTDGASAALLMSEAAAAAAGFAPVARLVDWLFVAQDPVDELLLGPAYAIARLLKRAGLAAADVGVWEIHEAFAGQVLANLNALDSTVFADKHLGWGAGAKVGRIPMDRINPHGGSLSIGHPFGATGTRLLTTAANRLGREGARFGVIAACAAGGQGHAMLIERPGPAPPAAVVAPARPAAAVAPRPAAPTPAKPA